MRKLIVCLIGPTAVGKTEVALQLAKRIGAEIISCDSMQVYKGIDIATSKPTKKQRQEVRHYLIDITSPTREFNAARFCTSAQKIIKVLHKRGKLPLIIVGTGLYLRALLDGLFIGPGQSADLRKKFYQQAERKGREHLYKKLKVLDPQTAQHIQPRDLRRIVRALEVYEQTGMPISRLKKKSYGIRDRYDVRIFGLSRQRSELYARIEKRVDRMFKRGLVAEIKKLTKLKMSKTAKSLLGYKEITGFLQGRYSGEEARRLLKRNTRHYAKRQLCWFKKEKGVKWIDLGVKDTPELVAEKILSSLRGAIATKQSKKEEIASPLRGSQ